MPRLSRIKLVESVTPTLKYYDCDDVDFPIYKMSSRDYGSDAMHVAFYMLASPDDLLWVSGVYYLNPSKLKATRISNSMPISFNGNGIVNVRKTEHLHNDRGFVSELERDLYDDIGESIFNAAVKACLQNEGVNLQLPI